MKGISKYCVFSFILIRLNWLVSYMIEDMVQLSLPRAVNARL